MVLLWVLKVLRAKRLAEEAIHRLLNLYSNHLTIDMVGVQLMATHTQTRKCNGDNLQNRVSTTIGPWRGGKFMPLTQKGHSVNTYCLSKIWIKSASVDMRVLDITKIISVVKSWIYADQQEAWWSKCVQCEAKSHGRTH